MKKTEILELGRRVIRLERESLQRVEDRLGDSFAAAVELIHSATGRVIVSGSGKSGLIGRKIAATLTSTGSPAAFLHPSDSLHGDLGIVGKDDVAILLSKSGESDEVLELLAHLKGFGVRSIAITGMLESSLARDCDVALDASVREEACPHDLAPTTSTTAALAIGDALAVALLQVKGFQREDFARLHPGGSLGRQLIVRVDDVMVRDHLPVLRAGAGMREAVVMIAERRGIAIVQDEQGKVVGILTAGDLSRLLEHSDNVFSTDLMKALTRNPKVARLDELASAVAYRMEQFGIMVMPVVGEGEKLVGVVHLHDLMRSRVR
jgi:arabinose-5-phosphate isomerase